MLYAGRASVGNSVLQVVIVWVVDRHMGFCRVLNLILNQADGDWWAMFGVWFNIRCSVVAAVHIRLGGIRYSVGRYAMFGWVAFGQAVCGIWLGGVRCLVGRHLCVRFGIWGRGEKQFVMKSAVTWFMVASRGLKGPRNRCGAQRCGRRGRQWRP